MAEDSKFRSTFDPTEAETEIGFFKALFRLTDATRDRKSVV